MKPRPKAIQMQHMGDQTFLNNMDLSPLIYHSISFIIVPEKPHQGSVNKGIVFIQQLQEFQRCRTKNSVNQYAV